MMKAIRITKENKSALEHEYEMDHDYLKISSGMYLVSSFGTVKEFHILSPARFRMMYNTTGEIKHGYLSIEPKTGP